MDHVHRFWLLAPIAEASPESRISPLIAQELVGDREEGAVRTVNCADDALVLSVFHRRDRDADWLYMQSGKSFTAAIADEFCQPDAGW